MLKWIIANSVLFAGIFTVVVGSISSVVGIVIASRRSLMGQFLSTLTENRKISQTHEDEIRDQFMETKNSLFDLQNKFVDYKNEAMLRENELRRDFAVKEEAVRNEILRYRNENTELIRCNDQLAQEIEKLKRERMEIIASNSTQMQNQDDRYNELLKRFNTLQAEHNTLRVQMQKMNDDNSVVIGIE